MKVTSVIRTYLPDNSPRVKGSTPSATVKDSTRFKAVGSTPAVSLITEAASHERVNKNVMRLKMGRIKASSVTFRAGFIFQAYRTCRSLKISYGQTEVR